MVALTPAGYLQAVDITHVWVDDSSVQVDIWDRLVDITRYWVDALQHMVDIHCTLVDITCNPVDIRVLLVDCAPALTNTLRFHIFPTNLRDTLYYPIKPPRNTG